MATILQRIKALPLNIGTKAKEGPKGFTVTFDFTGAPGTQQLNLDNASMGISTVQAVFFDNSKNASPTTLQVNGTSQAITFPPQSQGFMPLLLSGDTGVNVSVTTAGTVPVPITFLNTNDAGSVIYSSQGNVIVGTTVVSGTVTALSPTGVETAKNGNIAVGGTAVQIVPANANRKSIIIQNPTDETGQNIAARESLFINFGAAGGVNDGIAIELQPGGMFIMGDGGISTQAIYANAATAAHRFIAWELQ